MVTGNPPTGAAALNVTVTVETLPAESKIDAGNAAIETVGKSSFVIVADALAGTPTTYPAPAPRVTVAVAGPSNGTVLVAEIVHVPVPPVDTLTVPVQPFTTPVIAPTTDDVAMVTGVVDAGGGEIVTV